MLGLENPEEILLILDRYTALKQKDIPKELDEYLSFVARTGDPVYNWSTIQYLFREKLTSVIREFHDTTPSIEDLPPCPNVDAFNYENLKAVLLERLDLFNAAPFTVQRLCELLTNPKKHYCRLDKFMRALEKTILVVSTVEPGRKKADSENGDSLSLDVSLDSDMDRDVGASAAAAAVAVATLAANVEVSTTPAEDELPTDGSQEDETAAAVASVVDPCSEVAANIVVSSEESGDKIDDDGIMAEAEAEAINDDDGDVEVKDSLDGVLPVQAIDAAAPEINVNGAEAEVVGDAVAVVESASVFESTGDEKEVQIDVVDEKPATAPVVDDVVEHGVVESSAGVEETTSLKTETSAADGPEAMQADEASSVDVPESSIVVVAAAASPAVESIATSSSTQCEEAVSSIADDDITDSASVAPPVKELTSGKHALDDDDDDSELSNAKSAKIARLDDSVSGTAPEVESSVGVVTADTSAEAVDIQTAECSSTTELIAEVSSGAAADDSSIGGTEAVAASSEPIIEEPSSDSMLITDSTVAAAADSADAVVISEVSEAEAVTLSIATNGNSPVVLEPDSSSPNQSPDASDDTGIEEMPATSDAPDEISEAVVTEEIAAVVESADSAEAAAVSVVSNVIDDVTIEDVSTSGTVGVIEPVIVGQKEESSTGIETAVSTEQMAVEDDVITGAGIENIADEATPSPPPTDAAAANESNETMEATPIIPAAVVDAVAHSVATEASVKPLVGEQMDVDESNSADSMDI